MENDQKIKEIWWKPAITVFVNTSLWIAGPIIMALIFGKYLDNKYVTSPKFFLIFIVIAFIVTVFGIFQMFKKYMKKL